VAIITFAPADMAGDHILVGADTTLYGPYEYDEAYALCNRIEAEKPGLHATIFHLEPWPVAKED